MLREPDGQPQHSFGTLLRQYRRNAGLTQSELAERAGLSERAISDLERDVKVRPHRHTVGLLVDALGLEGSHRVALEAAVVRTRRSGGAQGGRQPGQTLSLPIPPTRFVGRETEIRRLCDLVLDESVRLLTLTGPAGVGKTRLALEVAVRVAGDAADGVVFISLASVRDPALVPSEIGRTLGIQETGIRPVLDLLSAHLVNRDLVLILDNFEQVVRAGEDISTLIAMAPRLTIVVTSRSPLNLGYEHEFAVSPLSLPDGRASPSVDALAASEAAALFVHRAQAVRPGFQITPENAEAVAEICRRLDGLPLALELGAAGLRSFSPQELVSRLRSRHDTLAGGPTSWPARHQTLRNAIDWSCDLLTPADQQFFFRLAVFAGGFTLPAVEAVCSQEETQTSVADRVESLTEMSLLTSGEDVDGDPRFRMLETVRNYAMERLEATGEAYGIQQRHAEYFLSLAERGELELVGADQADWLPRLELEHDNFRAALTWAQDDGDAEIGLRLAAALRWLWHMHGHFFEGRRWLSALLRRAPNAPVELQSKALNAAGILAMDQGDHNQAKALYEQALALSRERQDDHGVARALNNLGLVAGYQGEYDQARDRYKEALLLFREVGDTSGTANAIGNLGLLEQMQGNDERAQAAFEESAALFRELGDLQSVARSVNNLGLLAVSRGRMTEARVWYEESLSLFRRLDDKVGVARVLINLATVADTPRARALLTESLRLCRELGDKWTAAFALDESAAWLADGDNVLQAARLWGAADALRSAIDASLPPRDQSALEGRRQAACNRVLPADFWSAYEKGREMPASEALTLDLDTVTLP